MTEVIQISEEMEHKIAFTLIDFENLIDELEKEQIITAQEHEQLGIMKNDILKRTGFIVE